MLFYGKSAIGLAETLDIPMNTDELIAGNLLAAQEYLVKNQTAYLEFVLLKCNNKNNKTAEKAFLKFEHEQKRFLGEITTSSELIDLFYSVFPSVKEVLGTGAKLAVQNNYIATHDLFKRIRFFSPPVDTKEAKAIEREASNLPIQGKKSRALSKLGELLED